MDTKVPDATPITAPLPEAQMLSLRLSNVAKSSALRNAQWADALG